MRDSGLDRGTRSSSPPSCRRRRRPGGRVLDASLRALGLDHVDLWLVHWPPAPSDSVALGRRSCAARDAGRARAIGVSNYSSAQLDELIDATSARRRPSTRSRGARPATSRSCWPRTASAASCSRATARCTAPTCATRRWLAIAERHGVTPAAGGAALAPATRHRGHPEVGQPRTHQVQPGPVELRPHRRRARGDRRPELNASSRPPVERVTAGDPRRIEPGRRGEFGPTVGADLHPPAGRRRRGSADGGSRTAARRWRAMSGRRRPNAARDGRRTTAVADRSPGKAQPPSRSTRARRRAPVMSRRSRPRSRGWPTPPSTAGRIRASQRDATGGLGRDPVAAVERPRAEAAGQGIERDRDDHLRTVTTVAGKSCRGQRQPADLDQRVGATLPRRAVVGHLPAPRAPSRAEPARAAATAWSSRAAPRAGAARRLDAASHASPRPGPDARAAQGVERRPDHRGRLGVEATGEPDGTRDRRG